MRKLVFTLFVLVIATVFMACEQEDVTPKLEEPTEEFTEGSSDEESGGVKAG